VPGRINSPSGGGLPATEMSAGKVSCRILNYVSPYLPRRRAMARYVTPAARASWAVVTPAACRSAQMRVSSRLATAADDVDAVLAR
jgi:hypothetical protein